MNESGYPPRPEWRGLWIVMALLVGLAALCLFMAWPASAHEAGPLMPPGVQRTQMQGYTPSAPAPSGNQPLGWQYPWACCSGMDCQRVNAKPDQDVKETPQGYVIVSTGELVAYGDKRIKQSPDGDMHWCAHRAGLDTGHTICLFVPPKGF